jgi:hypothetical protein
MEFEVRRHIGQTRPDGRNQTFHGESDLLLILPLMLLKPWTIVVAFKPVEEAERFRRKTRKGGIQELFKRVLFGHAITLNVYRG